MHTGKLLSWWVLTGMLAWPARAEVDLEALFPRSVGTEQVSLERRGAALLKVRVFFKVYAMALYTEPGTPAERIFEDVPKRLDAYYVRDIPRAALIEAGQESLERQLEDGKLNAIQDRVDRINALYRDVKKGDRYTISYVPGQGTELRLNGEKLGVIEGSDFAAEYFRIWLGSDTGYPEFSRTLLGK